jgi:hypothetical protein
MTLRNATFTALLSHPESTPSIAAARLEDILEAEQDSERSVMLGQGLY